MYAIHRFATLGPSKHMCSLLHLGPVFSRYMGYFGLTRVQAWYVGVETELDSLNIWVHDVLKGLPQTCSTSVSSLIEGLYIYTYIE